jgi:1-acyl-sn-glycerol-3-phosphate acyltransferase
MYIWLYVYRYGNLGAWALRMAGWPEGRCVNAGVRAGRLKILMKEPLRKLPVVGWAMQLMAMIFLHRAWEADRPHLMKMLDYFRLSSEGRGLAGAALCARLAAELRLPAGYPVQLQLFPEGTDLTPETIAKSHKYAEENGLPKVRAALRTSAPRPSARAQYQHVLHPKTTGTVACIEQLQDSLVRRAPPARARSGSLHPHGPAGRAAQVAVVDLTVAYGDPVPEHELSLLRGVFPSSVNFHARRFERSALPKDAAGATRSPALVPPPACAHVRASVLRARLAGLAGWIRERWTAKERLLVDYHRKGAFDGAQPCPAVAPRVGEGRSPPPGPP